MTDGLPRLADGSIDQTAIAVGDKLSPRAGGIERLSLIRRGERAGSDRPDYRWWQELPGNETRDQLSAAGYEIVDFVRLSDVLKLRERQVSVVVDFLDAWRFCPVSQTSTPSRRSCLEDAAKQLVAVLWDEGGP